MSRLNAESQKKLSVLAFDGACEYSGGPPRDIPASIFCETDAGNGGPL